MTGETRRVLVVGASGVFGARLCRLIAPWRPIRLVLAARREAPLRALCEELRALAANPVETAILDRVRPVALSALAPWVVVDCAGPFQGADLGLARTALAAGANYLDLADARAFVSSFAESLDPAARAAGLCALTGASSTPALSHAAVTGITRGWTSIETIEVAIAPVARAPRGLSVMQAALSWVGQPVRVFIDGRWQVRRGWGDLRCRDLHRLGSRWLSLAETADLDLLATSFAPTREAVFVAGLELSMEHLCLWALSWLVRMGLVRSLTPLAAPLLTLSRPFARFGSDRGGMAVTARGLGPAGTPIRARWSLWAEAGHGPTVPTLAAAAVLRSWLDGPPEPGARACLSEVAAAQVLREGRGLPIYTAVAVGAPDDASLARRLMGPRFDALPASVRRVHDGRAPARFAGWARARGGGGLARLARGMAGMPGPGHHRAITVEIDPRRGGETWTRRFGAARFRSHLRDDPRHISRFEETAGALTFAFEADPGPAGFVWRFVGWRLGPWRLPRALAPRIRARCFDRDGAYRFSIAIAHPLAGLVLAYAGRLDPAE